MPLWFYSDSNGPVTVTFADHQEAAVTAASHTFTAIGIGAASAIRYVIACLMIGSGGATSFSSVTIGGITASLVTGTLIGPNSEGTYLAMYMALVPTGTTANIVVNTTGVNPAAWAAATYSITGISTVTPFQAATSTALNPTASMSCAANGAIVSYANGVSGSALTSTWAGIAKDFLAGPYLSTEYVSSAHTNFAVAQSGLSCTCSFTTSVGSVGTFAAFNPS